MVGRQSLGAKDPVLYGLSNQVSVCLSPVCNKSSLTRVQPLALMGDIQ
jgi:hypothetical protein